LPDQPRRAVVGPDGGGGMIDGVLREVFGLDAFRPGQAEAVEAAMRGQDALIMMPTGGGKSLCYQVPAVALARQGRGKTVVVSPLIALMDDQVAALRARGVAAVALHSGLEDAAKARAELKTAEIVYVSPERLAKPAARRALAAGGVALVAVDEAHCISQWGHDFRKDYLTLGVLRAEWGAPILALTATATGRVRDEICASLGMVRPLRVLGGVARPELSVHVEHHKGDKDRLVRLIAWIRARGLDKPDAGRVIVYAATRKRVVDVAGALNKAGIKAVHYHAGRTTGARAKAQSAFADGDRAVMVATCAFGMGIDLPDVRLVVHAQASGSLESWWQEAGRAGRDGAPADAVLLYADMDGVTQARLRGRSPPPGAEQGWRALVDFAYGTTCRQAVVTRHFLDQPGEACGVCDVCRGGESVAAEVAEARARGTERRKTKAAKEEADASFPITPEHEAAILAFVGRLKRPCGRKLVAQALRGSVAEAVKRRGLVSLDGHGALKGVPELAIDGAIGELMAQGRLVKKGRKYPTVWLADRPVRPTGDDAAAPKKARAPRYQGLAKVIADWRRAESRKRRVKPYQVLDNATLAVIVAERPSTPDALASLPGIGPKRLERYADAILRMVRAG
jgi:ATP-dependent DNA helicase RecQ